MVAFVERIKASDNGRYKWPGIMNDFTRHYIEALFTYLLNHPPRHEPK